MANVRTKHLSALFILVICIWSDTAIPQGTPPALALAKNDPFVLVKSDHTKSTLGSGFGARQTRMKIY